jgi:hypothetical protein
VTSIVTDDGTAREHRTTFNFEGGNGAIVSASGKTITITPKVQTIAETPNLQDELDLKASKAYADSLVVGLIDDREIMTHQQIHFRQQVDPERRARF